MKRKRTDPSEDKGNSKNKIDDEESGYLKTYTEKDIERI